MTLLVIGSSSVVGRCLISILSENKLVTRGMTRVADPGKQLNDQCQTCVADLENPAGLLPAFDGASKLFLMTPLHPDETKLGLAAVKTAVACKLEKIVYMSVQMSAHTDKIPHYLSKRPIEQAIVESGIAYTILRPNNFYQNDFWCKAAIMLYNTYPQPLGNKGVQRIDAQDVALAAANALINDQFDGQSINLNGPEVLTATSIAKHFSQTLGRNIVYSGDDLNAWAKQSRHMMPKWMLEELKMMYQYFQEHGAVASENDMQQQLKLLRQQPRTFHDFVEKIIPEWKTNHES